MTDIKQNNRPLLLSGDTEKLIDKHKMTDKQVRARNPRVTDDEARGEKADQALRDLGDAKAKE